MRVTDTDPIAALRQLHRPPSNTAPPFAGGGINPEFDPLPNCRCCQVPWPCRTEQLLRDHFDPARNPGYQACSCRANPLPAKVVATPEEDIAELEALLQCRCARRPVEMTPGEIELAAEIARQLARSHPSEELRAIAARWRVKLLPRMAAAVEDDS